MNQPWILCCLPIVANINRATVKVDAHGTFSNYGFIWIYAPKLDIWIIHLAIFSFKGNSIVFS